MLVGLDSLWMTMEEPVLVNSTPTNTVHSNVKIEHCVFITIVDQPCDDGGGCSDICAVIDGEAQCFCSLGYELSMPGGTQCAGECHDKQQPFSFTSSLKFCSKAGSMCFTNLHAWKLQ